MGRKKLLQNEEVVAAINAIIIQTGRPPTVEELRKELGVGSTRTVLRYLEELEKGGDIERWPGARGLRLRRQPRVGTKTHAIPVVGHVPAGPAMLAEENIEGWVRLPTEFVRPSGEKYFLLRVHGNSMNQAKIHGNKIEDGDLVLVRQQPAADTGDIVIALVDGEATVKRFERGPGYYVLKPESSKSGYQPIVLKSDFRIQGLVTKVIKEGAAILEG